MLRLQKIPYLASKNLFRVSAHLVSASKRDIDELCDAIKSAHDNVSLCRICHNWTEGELTCSICRHAGRNKTSLCVVETCYDLLSIEKTRVHRGVYHVLGGALCPLDGVGPDDLTIASLLKRIESGEVEELVFATNPTPEGEATADYIASKITGSSIGMSKLASGLPTGASLEYMDSVTIHRAFSGRRPLQ